MVKLRFPQRTQTRVALFVLGLALVFAGSFLFGSAVEPVETDTRGSHESAPHGGHGRASIATPASGLAVAVRR